jgi:hypothetical protein
LARRAGSVGVAAKSSGENLTTKDTKEHKRENERTVSRHLCPLFMGQ